MESRYRTSTDYELLYELVQDGKFIPCFMNIGSGYRELGFTQGMEFSNGSVLFESKEEYIDYCKETELCFVECMTEQSKADLLKGYVLSLL